jgi:hypothetical protein
MPPVHQAEVADTETLGGNMTAIREDHWPVGVTLTPEPDERELAWLEGYWPGVVLH